MECHCGRGRAHDFDSDRERYCDLSALIALTNRHRDSDACHLSALVVTTHSDVRMIVIGVGCRCALWPSSTHARWLTPSMICCLLHVRDGAANDVTYPVGSEFHDG